MYPRITIDKEKMGGIPCIRGLRIPVRTVAGMISAGIPVLDILRYYPDLDTEDIGQAVAFQRVWESEEQR